MDCFPQRVGACPYIPERNRAGLSAAGVLFGMTDLEPPAFQAATCCHLPTSLGKLAQRLTRKPRQRDISNELRHVTFLKSFDSF